MRQTKGSFLRFTMAALLVWIVVLCQSPALAAEEGTAVTIGTGIPETPKAEVTIQWDDAWFTRDASDYRQDLALSSMALSGAAYGREGKDVQEALKALGFEKIESYNYQIFNETGDQVAYTFGLKTVKDRAGKSVRLAAVIVRGTGDYTEWASNLDVGTQADHEGFAKAAEELQKNLEKYLSKAGITEKARGQMKFLLTGHSRGAAVANLLAVRLVETAKKENVYAYTFATPAVSTDAVREGYENIFNIINENDLVTQVPLAGWGYHRYGVDLALPTDSGKLFEQMNGQFKALTGQDYVSYHDPTTVEKMTDALCRLIPTTDGVNMEMFATLLSGDFKGLSELVKQNGFAALLMGKTAMEVSSQLTPMLQNEQGALRSGHCMAGYYSWLSVSGDFLTAEASE
ncbi:MAG: lipase family protein [Oscillibacter sp.]|nr:lipase family protein [Oscillibacter sp.]